MPSLFYLLGSGAGESIFILENLSVTVEEMELISVTVQDVETISVTVTELAP